MLPLGVIDIGSNSVRLVVYGSESGAVTLLFNEKILCGLGRSVAIDGSLSEEATERALRGLERFRAIATRIGVVAMKAVATAAVREASNGVEFVAAAREICGVDIDVLSGEREALLAANGIKMGFVDPVGIAGDLGGGSLEFIDLCGDDSPNATTLPLGGLRLAQDSENDVEAARKIVDRELEKVDWLSEGKGRDFFAIGGTWRAIAKLHMSATNYPLHVTQGYAIDTAEAKAFARTVVKSKKLGEFSGIDDISRARREVIPYGALVLERLLTKMKPERVVFSVFGLREGVLYEMLPEQDKGGDALLEFCENFASINSRSVEYAHELCRWSEKLFASLSIGETADERRMREAACLLSDIGWRRHPDYREDQVPGMVAYSGMSGVDHPGRMFLALTMYYRYAGVGSTGRTDTWAGLRSVIGAKADRRARIIACAVRLAHVLSASMAGVIGETSLLLEGDNLFLTLPKKHAVLDGERLRRRIAGLASLLGATPEVVVV